MTVKFCLFRTNLGRASFHTGTTDLGLRPIGMCEQANRLNSLLSSRDKTAAKQRRSNRPSTLEERTMDSTGPGQTNKHTKLTRRGGGNVDSKSEGSGTEGWRW